MWKLFLTGLIFVTSCQTLSHDQKAIKIAQYCQSVGFDYANIYRETEIDILIVKCYGREEK